MYRERLCKNAFLFLTSMNDGTQKDIVVPVATIPSQTASGVGTVGGDAGLNTATIRPTTGYAHG